MPFSIPLDIQNRACQHLGATRISQPDEDSVNNAETSFAYDKVRRAELRRNSWRFAIKKIALRPIDTTTFLLSPALWNEGVQYLPGSVVSDADGYLWVSTQANNINNQPGLNDVWEGYYGSMTVDAFDASGSTAYFAGDLVYVSNPSGLYNGSYVVYMSMQNANTETPNIADTWSATATYQQDETVFYNGQQWRSLIAINHNIIPNQGPANWVATQAYFNGDIVTGTDGFIYSTPYNNLVGINPVTDNQTYWYSSGIANAWTATPVVPTSSSLWVPLYASLSSFNFVYPIGYGPASQEFTRNIFRLPANYLREAPQNPKAGMYSFLGAPAYNTQDDWEFEGDYLLSQVGTPIIFRFIADVTNVSEMDDMFCESLAARIGVETCETITNSNAKKQTCINEYKQWRGEAITVNGIEVGPTEPPEDDYIACRL